MSPSRSISHKKLDEWMRESVVEIVNNLKEAPLLLHVYRDEKRKRTEKAVVEEEWAAMKKRWEEEGKPEGVIFVERLEEEGVEGWGVVVQGRGAECGPACYLLKTNRVGPACHFCLVRVNSFRETAKKQLEDCWLLNDS
ncbi:hypothetical protein CFOL_v3_06025 [Cephalotus follicularis]|uniref:DUF7804 domain-containing protein n=1 Tax=Cephalotus follicularis TaxID=3775 RepID=A0A1Q3B3Y9_CEPFO|nr:hypothetical protein CFOL_v3_06025 [Cephalotus follicularis]